MTFSPEEITLISTALGGVLGLASGIGGGYFIEKWKSDRFARSIARAFYGEISSVCKIIRHRKYVEEFKEFSKKLGNGEDVNRKAMKADAEYFSIYKSNVNHVGLLGADLPEKIVTFYTHGTAVLEDIHALESGYHDDKTIESMSDYFLSISDMFYEMLKQGDDLLQSIEREYS